MLLQQQLVKQRIHYLIEHGGVYPVPAPAGRKLILQATLAVVALLALDILLSIIDALT